MSVLIESHSVEDGNHYLTLSSGKKSANVFKTSFEIRVICKNASHSVWRGAGRGFDTWEEAIAGYKSSEMKAMIECARCEIEGDAAEAEPESKPEAEPEANTDCYGNVRRTDDEAVKIRKLRGTTDAMIDSYDPAAAVYKLGKGCWSLTSVMGNSHPHICKTKREAIEFAESHHKQMAKVHADHTGYADIRSYEAEKTLELMKEFREKTRHYIDTEIEAWTHADRLLEEFYSAPEVAAVGA